MYKNPGIQKEYDIIKLMNGKKFKQLSNNLKNIVCRMFEDYNDNTPFIVEKADPRGKPDVIISHNGETHYMSMKSGNNENVHGESVTKFVSFLRDYGVSEETIETILLYQYGDGTTDGTGDKRKTRDELVYEMKDRIEKANREMNGNSKLVFDFFMKVVFVGNFYDLPKADYIYHGNMDYGVLCSRVQIEKHIRRRRYDRLSNLHIGPIIFRPYARYVEFNETYSEKRHITFFRWVGMLSDMEYITNRYDG